MTRMQLIRTLAAWRPDLTAHRDVEAFVERLWRSVKYEEVVCCERVVSA